MKIIKLASIAGAALAPFVVEIGEAYACGGFFCGRQPVDQTAERILFEIGEDSVTMTTQISFAGDAADFAWILPLPEVPDPESLAIFPQRALTALDTNTGPDFVLPSDCYSGGFTIGGGFSATSGATGTDGGGPPPVQVHVRAEVGGYDVAVIESEDPAALIEWLRTEGYRVTEPMEPYIELYAEEGMKFLALKLLETSDVADITPFRFTLPGDVPSIPLRMTALAAEPEMSIVVFVLGDQRFEGKNWENLDIADDEILFQPNSWPVKTNWTSLVAREVDAAGGQGWVTEYAGTTTDMRSLIDSQISGGSFATPEDEEAAHALAEVLAPHAYLTRFYSRLSAEEMTFDPIFGRSAGDDVSRVRQLSRIVAGVDQCPDVAVSSDPCVFATCGAGGICRTTTQVDQNGYETTVAACGCVPGATARTTFAPDGTPTVICQDQRMSFLNPGDQEAGAEALPDPCATFSCGDNGSCVSVNMTPTCVCDEGFVAVGSVNAEGMRLTTCVAPDAAVPDSFYDQRLPALPPDLPGGRVVEVPEPETTSGAGGSGGSGGSSTSNSTTTGSTDASTSGNGGSGGGSPSAADSKASGGGGCSVGHAAAPVGTFAFAFAGLLFAAARRRREASERRSHWVRR
ncbi:MAG TPA: DUF2330 domain-containing protein [Polyangiaceae bacterium]|nr:DUF2330 domain-containing protein [Polyangiaceae bacterium]